MEKRKLENVTLSLFFTAGTSLRTWAETGNLAREIEIYSRLAEKLKRINLITYGGKDDKAYAKELGDLRLLTANWYPYPELTAFNLALRSAPRLMSSDIFKTNQIRGAKIAVWLKKVFKKKLIVRCGFLHSYFTRKQTEDQKRIEDAVNLEKMAFTRADLGIVTSSFQRDIPSYNRSLPLPVRHP